jgi:replicative DNA helicase
LVGYDPAADPASAPGAIGDEYKPHPCPRIIIPTSPGHYVGRRIDGGKEFAKINAKGSSPAIFNKSALYAEGAQEVFITEGAFDALSVLEVGAPAIAINSASNVPILLQELKSKPTTATLVLCLDNDEAGKRAAQEIGDGLQRLQIPFLSADITNGHHDPNDALAADRSTFSAAVEAARRQAHKDYLSEFLDTIKTEAYKPYTTGLKFFDDLLCGGVIRQTLLLLLAAPGTGKTTLAQQIGEQMAAHGKPVVYLNLEMSREQMTAKAISSRLARKGHKMTALQVMQGYRWTNEQRAAVVEAVDEYREQVAPHITYNPDGIGSDLERIKSYLQRIGENAKADGKQAPVVILDYLHLVSSGAGLDTKELIKQAVTALKEYAIKYNTFVIGIVATNRDSNRGGRITMESGRDSSNLEYTADYQLSLNYYDIDNGTVKPSDIEEISRLQQQKWRQMIIRVLKGRFVTPGRTARVYFNAANNLFYGEGEFVPLDDNDFTPFDKPLDTDKPAGESKSKPKRKKAKRI